MITLSTIIWEKNFDDILSPDSWFFKFSSDLITTKLLIISNVPSVDKTLKKIATLHQHHKFDVVWVKDIVDEVKNTYNLSMDESTVGYHYTIPFFVTLESTNTKFLLCIANDCMDDIFVDDYFLKQSIEELETNPLCFTTGVAWNKNNASVPFNNKTVGEHEEDELLKTHKIDTMSTNFTYSLGFSDQFWLGATDALKSIDYHLAESYSSTYHGPTYGGNSFEKRLVAHHNFKKVYRCICKGNQYYIHDKII